MESNNYPEPPHVSELDVYRSANVLVSEYGGEASIIAAMRADAMLAHGDIDGYAVWKRIMRAVRDLQQREPGEDESLH